MSTEDPRPDAARDDAAAELLRRSARALAEHEESGWPALGEHVAAVLRRTSRRRVLLRADLPADPRRSGDGLLVGDQVVVVSVRSALQDLTAVRLLRVHVEDEDHTALRVEVHVSVRFSADVDTVAAEVRTRTAGALAAVLGPVRGSVPVDVLVDEVHTDDTPAP